MASDHAPATSRVQSISIATLMAAFLAIALGLANLLTVTPPPQTIEHAGLVLDLPVAFVPVSSDAPVPGGIWYQDERNPERRVLLAMLIDREQRGVNLASRTMLVQLLGDHAQRMQKLSNPQPITAQTSEGHRIKGVRYLFNIADGDARGMHAMMTFTLDQQRYWLIYLQERSDNAAIRLSDPAVVRNIELLDSITRSLGIDRQALRPLAPSSPRNSKPI